jgi:hypothetical protein
MLQSPLTEAFERQTAWCREPSPFTARLLDHTARWLRSDAEAHAALAAIAADPLAAAVPLRWAGALHHLALRGLAPWADLWPPRRDAAALQDTDFETAIAAAWHGQRAAVMAALAGPPQTNEVQRSAALLPGLLHVAAATGLPLALLEIGASAGLNLWCERHGYDFGAWAWGDVQAPLQLRCDWRGPVPAVATAPLHISSRAACDAQPIDLTQPGQALRLASFIWPDQAERLLRLRTAMAASTPWLAAEGVQVEAASAADFVARQLQQLRPGRATVLMHSVVWQYIDAAEQAAIERSVLQAGRRASVAAPLAWLRLEPVSARGGVELRCRLWPGGEDRQLARAHPHVAWLEWLA